VFVVIVFFIEELEFIVVSIFQANAVLKVKFYYVVKIPTLKCTSVAPEKIVN
jgi:hypothetical protein